MKTMVVEDVSRREWRVFAKERGRGAIRKGGGKPRMYGVIQFKESTAEESASEDKDKQLIIDSGN